MVYKPTYKWGGTTLYHCDTNELHSLVRRMNSEHPNIELAVANCRHLVAPVHKPLIISWPTVLISRGTLNFPTLPIWWRVLWLSSDNFSHGTIPIGWGFSPMAMLDCPGGTSQFAVTSPLYPTTISNCCTIVIIPTTAYNLGLFKVIFYFPNGQSTMTGESVVIFFLFFGDPLSKSKITNNYSHPNFSGRKSPPRSGWSDETKPGRFNLLRAGIRYAAER